VLKSSYQYNWHWKYNRLAFITADHRFHFAIAKATGNSLAPLMLDPIVDLLDEQRK